MFQKCNIRGHKNLHLYSFCSEIYTTFLCLSELAGTFQNFLCEVSLQYDMDQPDLPAQTDRG